MTAQALMEEWIALLTRDPHHVLGTQFESRQLWILQCHLTPIALRQQRLTAALELARQHLRARSRRGGMLEPVFTIITEALH